MSKRIIIGGNGAIGSNSNAVFNALFDQSHYEYFNAEDFETLLNLLVLEKIQKIILPVSNSVIGEVKPAINAYKNIIKNKSVKLVEEQEYMKPIHHALICNPPASIKTITKIYCFPVAADQCRKKLNELGIEEVFHPDTYGAVVDVIKNNNAHEAAIGPIEAAKDLNGKILIENLSDDPFNTTTFKVFSKA